jgi:hypothetical protein
MIGVAPVPFLERLRELYVQPRGFERFQSYLALLASETGEMELPISAVNPMGKAHVLACVEHLIALDAEGIALEAAREGALRLGGDDELRLVTIVADDAMGGWTNRAFAEFAHRYERKHEVQRGWVTVLLWSSEEPTRDLVRVRALESLYRTVDERRHGPVRTLREILYREGRALAFAGVESPYDDEAYRATVEPYLESHRAPVVMACYYGDEVAASLGYPPLGVTLQKREPLAQPLR